MEFDLSLHILPMLIGFCVAGLVALSFQLATGRPMSFALEDMDNPPLAFLSIVLRLIAGPAILIRSVFATGSDDDWGPVLAVVFLVLALGWSILSGTVIIESLTSVSAYQFAQPA